MAYQVLARKWRPKTFSNLKGQEHVTRALINALTHQQLHHAYLFTGTRGVGKTTIARILAKSLNCAKGITPQPCGQCTACLDIDAGRFVDLIEVDAASRTRVEDTRDLLENVQYAPSQGRFKIYLIDEVHMLSGHSFNALLKTIEEPPAHVKFILATTDPERIPVTILSRCIRFSLRPISSIEIASNLALILQEEKIPFEMGACQLVAQLASGSMRDALSLLEQAIAFCDHDLKTSLVEEMLGLSYQRLMPALMTGVGEKNVADCLKIIEEMANGGADFELVLSGVLKILHTIAIAQAVNIEQQAIASFAQLSPELLSLKEKCEPEEIQLLYQIALMGARDLRFAPDPRTGFEMILLRMMVFQPSFAGTGISHPMTQSALPKATTSSEENAKLTPIEASSPIQLSPVVPQGSASEDTLDWLSVSSQLSLSGLTKILVKHCVVVSWNKSVLSLMLEESQKTCLSDQRKMQIQEALSQYFGRPIKVIISIGQIQGQTPSMHEAAVANERENQAKQAVKDDKVVQAMMSTFGATVEKITVLDEK